MAGSRRSFLRGWIALAILPRGLRAAASAAEGVGPDPHAAQVLLGMARILYPHSTLPLGVYRDAAAAVLARADAESSTHDLIAAGIADLDRSAGGDWLLTNRAAQLDSLKRRESTSFFELVRGSVAFSLYTRPDVWSAFGYGGDAWSFGGYQGKILDDIDWLPEPVIR